MGPPGGHFGFCRRLYVSHRRSALIKQPMLQELFGVPTNLGLDTFSDPVCHFGPLGSHFGFYRQLYVSHRRSAHIKDPILQKLFGAPNNYLLSFWGPSEATLVLVCGGALQVVCKCPRHCLANFSSIFHFLCQPFLVQRLFESENLFCESCLEPPII